MSDYKIIFRICLRHEYYSDNICTGIQMSVSVDTLSLMKRRGLMFRQTRDNEWCIIGDCEGAGVVDLSDVLTLEMRPVHHTFISFTDWEGSDHTKTYQIELPSDNLDINIVSEMNKNQVNRVGGVLCLINLRLSNRMFELAKEGKEMEQTFVFHNLKKYWEILFIHQDQSIGKKIKLEEARGQMIFEDITQIHSEMFGCLVSSTRTTMPIPMKERYDYQISLKEVVREVPLTERTVIRNVPLPRISQFRSEDQDVIQQICYY